MNNVRETFWNKSCFHLDNNCLPIVFAMVVLVLSHESIENMWDTLTTDVQEEKLSNKRAGRNSEEEVD